MQNPYATFYPERAGLGVQGERVIVEAFHKVHLVVRLAIVQSLQAADPVHKRCKDRSCAEGVVACVVELLCGSLSDDESALLQLRAGVQVTQRRPLAIAEQRCRYVLRVKNPLGQQGSKVCAEGLVVRGKGGVEPSERQYIDGERRPGTIDVNKRE